MTKHITIIIGSARKGRVADHVLAAVQREIQKNSNLTTTVADLATMNLPFYDNEHAPSNEHFHNTHPVVDAWSKVVQQADVVLFLTPEYNHSLSAIQKNAIDWLYAEWRNKPTLVVTYGWYGGVNALVTLREVASVVKLSFLCDPVQLYFEKDLAADGTLIDVTGIAQKITTALSAIDAIDSAV